MFEDTIVAYETPILGPGDHAYRGRSCGRPRADGTWVGWLEFEAATDGSRHRTPRETTQPNRTALEYWATGLTPVFLQGALTRALEAEPDDELDDETL